MAASAPSKVAIALDRMGLKFRVSSGRASPRLLLVTGMSGAGKSTVLDALEDMGWDVVDNLPADLLEGFVLGGGECRLVPAAVGMDVRSRGFDAANAARANPRDPRRRSRNSLSRLRRRRADPPLRRDPAPASARAGPARRGRDRPRARADRAAEGSAADSVLDTTDLKPADLRDELRRRYGGDSDQPVLTIASFAFARGISRTADLVFDLRFLPNPHWVEALRPLTGADPAVRDYLAADPAWGETLGRHRSASHRLDSPLLGRGQKLRDRRVRMHGGTPSLGGGRSRDGRTVAQRRICSECPPP